MKKKSKGRKKISIQKKFRNKKFIVDQYWNMHYTICYANREEKDYKSFIKAKSYELAKLILKNKIKKEYPKSKVKSLIGFMFHGKYKRSQSIELSLENWEQIKLASFPNINDFLFKKEVVRPKGHSNRFNKTNLDHLCKIGFKKGKDNWSTQNRKGKFLPLKDRKGKKWNGGEWIDWDKKEMKEMKDLMIDALVKNANKRTLACAHMGISRNKFYKLMHKIEGKSWWDEKYPAPKPKPPILPTEQRSKIQKRTMLKRMSDGHIPFSYLTKDHINQRAKNKRLTERKKRIAYLKEMIPKIKDALEKNNHHRAKSAKYLGLKSSHFFKLLAQSKKMLKIDWSQLYPTKNGKSQYKV